MNKLVNYFKQNADATQKIKVLYNQNDLDWDKQYAGSDKSTKKFLSQLDKLPHKICRDEENKIEIMVETILAKQQEQKQDIEQRKLKLVLFQKRVRTKKVLILFYICLYAVKGS